MNECVLAKCLTELNTQACKAELRQGDLRVCALELITPPSWAGLSFHLTRGTWANLDIAVEETGTWRTEKWRFYDVCL